MQLQRQRMCTGLPFLIEVEVKAFSALPAKLLREELAVVRLEHDAAAAGIKIKLPGNVEIEQDAIAAIVRGFEAISYGRLRIKADPLGAVCAFDRLEFLARDRLLRDDARGSRHGARRDCLGG